MTDYEAELERVLRDRIADIHRRAQQEAAPYVEQLVRILARRPPPPLILTREQVEAMKMELPSFLSAKPPEGA